MANQEIDSLSLEISIKGLNDKDIKNLESLADSIAKLQRNLKKLETNKLQEIEIPQKLQGFDGVLTPTMAKAQKPQKVDEVLNLSTMKKSFEELNKMTSDFATNFQMDTSQRTLELPITKGMDDLIDKTKLANQLELQIPVNEGGLPKINTDIQALNINTKKANKELDKTSKNIKKPRKQLSAIEKQLNRIKTIGLIKLIRGAMQGFIKGMSEGYKNLALFDSKFNETLSTLKTAKTQAFNSFALITAPLVSVIAPIVQNISNGLAEMANNVSEITSSLKGATTYTKINSKYMEDYAKSMEKAQAFSFDTFNSLDIQDNNMFETAEVDEVVDKTSDIYSIFSDVKDTIEELKTFFGEIVNLAGGFLKDNMGNIREIISQSKEFTDTIMGIFSKIDFTKLLKVITKIIGDIINNTGIVLDLVEGILEAASPLIEVIIEDLLPAILEMVNDPINTIFMVIKAISPIITTLVELIASVLTPILKVISPIISTIGSIISRIVEGIVWLVENFLTTKIVEALKGITTLLQPVIEVVSWILKAVGEIFNMIDALLHGDWEGFAESLGKFFASIGIAILKFFAGVIDFIINGVIEAINFILTPLRETIKAFGGEFNGITWRSNLVGSVPSYANGGIVGELWQMNEYGNPEMLYSANGNSTAVITQEQLARAFENAIFNTGLLDAITDSKNIYIDGKNIAQSKNFKSELNRTNPNLNIR